VLPGSASVPVPSHWRARHVTWDSLRLAPKPVRAHDISCHNLKKQSGSFSDKSLRQQPAGWLRSYFDCCRDQYRCCAKRFTSSVDCFQQDDPPTPAASVRQSALPCHTSEGSPKGARPALSATACPTASRKEKWILFLIPRSQN
jgi:hypothetical protein